MQRTKPDSLRSCLEFRLNFTPAALAAAHISASRNNYRKASYPGRNNEAWVGIEPSPCYHGRRKNDATNQSAALLTIYLSVCWGFIIVSILLQLYNPCHKSKVTVITTACYERKPAGKLLMHLLIEFVKTLIVSSGNRL